VTYTYCSLLSTLVLGSGVEAVLIFLFFPVGDHFNGCSFDFAYDCVMTFYGRNLFDDVIRLA
jgi:hypothetical protein